MAKRTLLTATKHALNGLQSAFKTEVAIRQEILLLIIAIPLAILLSSSWIEFIILVFPCFLLLIVELLNTAIETAINRISLEKHPLSKATKDIAATAVFFATLFVILVWGIKLFIILFL